MRVPNEPQVCHLERSSVAVVALRVLDRVDRIDAKFSTPQFQIAAKYSLIYPGLCSGMLDITRVFAISELPSWPLTRALYQTESLDLAKLDLPDPVVSQRPP